ncbi:MAG: cation-translocating P-type ATPase [Chloroflexota bacterium]
MVGPRAPIEPPILAPGPAPWSRDVADVLAELGADPRQGLTSDEAARRLVEHGPNELQGAPTTPAWRRLLAQFQSPLVYLLLVAIAISMVVWLVEGAQSIPYEALVIAAIVAIDAVLGYAQEERAEQAVAALRRAAAPLATVLRDGHELEVPSAALVPGDILALAEGDAIGADARLFEAATLLVAEAPLTGESEVVTKSTAALDGPVALGDRSCMVFRGTAVARGRGRAVVTATGMATEVGAIAGLLGRTHEQETPLQVEVARIGRALGIAVVAIAVVVVAAILMTSHVEGPADLVSVLLVGVSLAVAAVPESLPAVLAIVLALGVQRMAKRHAIVKRLASVESLGAATVICSDKTGTLTRNQMSVEVMVTGSGTVEVTGIGYQPVGELLVGGRPLDDDRLLDEVRWLLAAGSLANDARLEPDGDGWSALGDPTEVAFLVAEAKVDGLREARTSRFQRVGEVPFSAERKLMSTLEVDRHGELGVALVTKGAPDVLLLRCDSERVAGEVRPLDDARRAHILALADGLADRALRTLGVAYRPYDPASLDAGVPTVDESSEASETWLGMVGIIDPPRATAGEAVAEASAAGIRTVMITGDHPRTALRIATDLGIAGPADRVLTGIDLDSLDEAALREAAVVTPVYARVSPEHKMRIIEALRSHGHVVAMTGDGVNDAPALRAADIGISMGLAGTDVAREASDLVLADDDYATIVAAVQEGRGIIAAIRRVLRFLLSSNTGEVLTMLLGVLFGGILGTASAGESMAVPLLATQILWINLLTDSAPALAMAFDPPPDDAMRRRPRGVDERLADREMWAGIVWVGVVMAIVTLIAFELHRAGGLLGGTGSIELARTMAFTTLVVAQLFNCFNARSGRTSAFHRALANPLLWGAVALSFVLQVVVVSVPFLNEAFGTVPLSFADWAACIALSAVVLVAGELWKWGLRRFAPDGRVSLPRGSAR